MTTQSQNEKHIARFKTAQSNQGLNLIQKQIACENNDRAAMQADWINSSNVWMAEIEDNIAKYGFYAVVGDRHGKKSKNGVDEDHVEKMGRSP